MDIRKLPITTRKIMAFTMIAALAFSCLVRAASIGDVVLQSKPGEPLLAHVDLTVGSGEHIENSCLFLTIPDPLQEDISGFLTDANLSLRTEGARHFIDISSHQPFNEAFNKLRLQVKCPGTHGVIKILTISSSAQGGHYEPKSVSSGPKLTSESINEMRLEKISTEEGAILLERQKLLEANFLALQHQVNQLQNELRELKSPSAQPGSAPLAAMSSAASSTLQLAPPTLVEPTVATKHLVVAQQGSLSLRNGLFLALGTFLAILLGLRHYSKTQSRNRIKSQQITAHILKPADEMDTGQKLEPLHIAKPPLKIKTPHSPISVAPTTEKTTGGKMPSPLPSSSHNIAEEANEEDSMLEEAGLYANYGHSAKAIEILRDLIKLHPSKAEAWSLLLSIYSALGRATEFENTARDFLKYHKDSPSWEGLQALGRTLDKDNPLYTDKKYHISIPSVATSRRSVGDILIEMGALSQQDLQSCLDDFDPRKHGRLGGYLVTRKVISLAELDRALLQQQGVNIETNPETMPSLQDIENFLADFDPKRDGSVSDYMASRNAVTPEQLGHLLQQQSGHRPASGAQQASGPQEAAL